MNTRAYKTYSGFKWGLAFREIGSLIAIVASMLVIHFNDFPWLGNIIITFGCLLIIFLFATSFHVFGFKRWYNTEVRVIEYDPISMSKGEVVQMPKSDDFWEYISILGILVLPLSFFFSYIAVKELPSLQGKEYFGRDEIIRWSVIIGALFVYLLFVATPILSNLIKSKYNYTPELRRDYKVTRSVKQLKKALQGFDDLTTKLKQEEDALRGLEIPVPATPSTENPAPYVEYVGTIAEIGKTHSNVASLEQLLLSVTSFPNLEGWSGSLLESLKSIGSIGTTAASGMTSAVKSMSHFVAHPDNDTSSQLLSNIAERLKESGQSQFFKYKLLHSHNKLFAFGKEGLKDVGKGAADTFVPDDLGENLHSSFAEAGESFEELFSHFVPEFDLPGDELFDVDFDFTGHFPIISTTREVFKNIGRFTDGDVDMGTSLAHSFTKIAGVGGGATLGAAIGTLIFPGVGSIIGGMIGGWLGKSGASKLNAMEFERLKAEFESEKLYLDSLVSEAQRVIQNKQTLVNEVITAKAVESNEFFKESQDNSPLEEFDISQLLRAFSIIIYDYIWECAEQYSPKNKPFRYDNDKYTMLLNILPTRYEVANISKDTVLYRMISDIEELTKNNIIKEPDYIHFTEIIKIFHNVIIGQALSLQALHLVWMEKTRLLYTNGVRAVTETMEKEFETLNNVVKEQEEIVCEQSDKCKRLAEEANNEAKTL